MASVIAWHELFTSDVEAAARFYSELLGVELEKRAMGDFEYVMLQKDGRTHAGFVPKPPEMEAPSHWYPYIQADDVDAAVDQAKALGAQVYTAQPRSASMLRFAVLGDPQHASFGLMRLSEEPPTGVFAWDELYAADVDAAKDFYGRSRAGRRARRPSTATEFFDSGEAHVGGLMKKTDEMPVAAWVNALRGRATRCERGPRSRPRRDGDRPADPAGERRAFRDAHRPDRRRLRPLRGGALGGFGGTLLVAGRRWADAMQGRREPR